MALAEAAVVVLQPKIDKLTACSLQMQKSDGASLLALFVVAKQVCKNGQIMAACSVAADLSGLNSEVVRRKYKELKKALKKHVDFRDAPTLIHDLIKQHCPHDTVRFYPKCHCELPAVERFFCEHKRYARANTRFNLPGLRQIASQGLDAVCKESVRRHFGLCRRYEKAMIDGVPLMSRDKVVKENRYTSHRRTKKSAETASPGAFTQLDIAPNNLCFCSTCCDERLPQVASDEARKTKNAKSNPFVT